MASITFYPLGNADCCLIKTDKGSKILFDFADTRDSTNKDDKRIALLEAVRKDIGWPNTKEIDILAITHGDDDHVRKICDGFFLESKSDCQSDDHIKFKELWIPANLLTEVGAEDHTKIIRQEARHRFREGTGIRVFSRPEALREWCEANDIAFCDREHLITDAGQLVPGWNKATQGIEFFVHSPFAHRQDEGFDDRNGNCLVMQAVIESQGRETKVLITADSISENWQEIVKITKSHENHDRLRWDLLKIPHHCSYLSMSEEIGDEKTTPTEEFQWLLEQGSKGGVIVSTSKVIPTEYGETQPPHLETFKTYKGAAEEISGKIFVTMEHPSKEKPDRLHFDINCAGVVSPQVSIGFAIPSIIGSAAPRNG